MQYNYIPVVIAEESDVKLVGGDIKLTGAQQLELEFALKEQDGDIFGPQNAVISRADRNWPNGVVYYRLDSGLGSEYYLANIIIMIIK